MSPLTFFGDILLTEPYQSSLNIKGDYIINLEGPITKAPHPVPGKICLKTEHDYIHNTFGRNPLAVCLANNHIMDYGPQGLADTIATLEQSGINYFGAGTLENNVNNPLILHIDGLTVALLGYVCPTTYPIFATENAPGVVSNELWRIQRDINLARHLGAERVVVQLHWGEERVALPRASDVRMARAIVDAGADMIIGHHTHCIQPYECYRGKYIFYSLGNAIFPNICYPPLPSKVENVDTYFRWVWPWWSRRSLMPTINLDTLCCTVKKIGYSACDVYELTGGERWRRDSLDWPFYEKAVNISRMRSVLINSMAQCMLQRKMPFSRMLGNYVKKMR